MEFPDPIDEAQKNLKYDRDWLAILQSTFHLTSIKNEPLHLHSPFSPPILTEENLANIDKILKENSEFIPLNFVATQPPYPQPLPANYPYPLTSPQTDSFLAILSLENPLISYNNNNNNNNNNNINIVNQMQVIVQGKFHLHHFLLFYVNNN